MGKRQRKNKEASAKETGSTLNADNSTSRREEVDSKGVKEVGKNLTTTCFNSAHLDESPVSEILNPGAKMESKVKTSTVEKARNVFLSTACHFCKRVATTASSSQEKATPGEARSPSVLNWCGGCRMVKYCSRSHQSNDWKSHKPLCKLVQQYLQVHRQRTLYEGVCEQNLSETDWLQTRCQFMELFRFNLGRELHSFEKEILLFPNACAVCRQVDSGYFGSSKPHSELTTCSKCHGISFCSNHFQEGHEHCQDLKIWTEIVRWEHENGLAKPELEIDLNSSWTLSDLPASIQKYYLSQNNLGHEVHDIRFIRLTDVLTVPLSMAWMLNQIIFHPRGQLITNVKRWMLDDITSLTIHLIGAESEFEGNCPTKWEVFLHLFPKLQQLHIVLIGPELHMSEKREQLSLCSKCIQEKRQILLEYETVLYDEYCEKSEFVEPNIICAFNCGLYRTTGFVDPNEDSWKPTLLRLKVNSAQPSMVVATEYTDTEIAQCSSRIRKECKLREIPELCCRNPYRSLRPQRTLINENIHPLMFKNNFISLFVMNE